MRVAPEATTPVQRHPGHVQLNVGIPQELDRRLRSYTNRTGTPLSATVIRALRRWFADHDPGSVREGPA